MTSHAELTRMSFIQSNCERRAGSGSVISRGSAAPVRGEIPMTNQVPLRHTDVAQREDLESNGNATGVDLRSRTPCKKKRERQHGPQPKLPDRHTRPRG
jgi:hypothetical protein